MPNPIDLGPLKALHAAANRTCLYAEADSLYEKIAVIDDRGVCLATFSWLSDARLYVALVAALPALAAELQSLRERVVSVETEAAQAIARASQLAEHQDSTRSKIEAERDRLRAERDAAQREFGLISRSFTAACAERDAAKDTIATLRAELATLQEQKTAFDIRSKWVAEMQALGHSEGWCRNVSGESMVDFFTRKMEELTAARDENAGLREALGVTTGACQLVNKWVRSKTVEDAIPVGLTALARTSSQHRKAIEAEVLRRMAETARWCNLKGYELLGKSDLLAEADRLERGE